MSSKSITVAGSIHSIGDVVSVGAKGFQKREVVVLIEDGKYPQHVPVEFTGDKIDAVTGYNVGDPISIECNLRGREWKGNAGPAKYFLSLSAWKINGEQRARSGANEPVKAQAAAPQDDIPFASCAVSDEPSPIARVLR